MWFMPIDPCCFIYITWPSTEPFIIVLYIKEWILQVILSISRDSCIYICQQLPMCPQVLAGLTAHRYSLIIIVHIQIGILQWISTQHCLCLVLGPGELMTTMSQQIGWENQRIVQSTLKIMPLDVWQTTQMNRINTVRILGTSSTRKMLEKRNRSSGGLITSATKIHFGNTPIRRVLNFQIKLAHSRKKNLKPSHSLGHHNQDNRILTLPFQSYLRSPTLIVADLTAGLWACLPQLLTTWRDTPTGPISGDQGKAKWNGVGMGPGGRARK